MSLVEILKVLVLGIVEGFTEWLPISSTGHMILVDEIIQLNQPEAYKTVFRVVIQLGAILAVVLMYFRKLNPLSRYKNQNQKEATWILWIKIIAGLHPRGGIRAFAGRLDGRPSVQRLCGGGYADPLRRSLYPAGEQPPGGQSFHPEGEPDFL